MKKKSLKKIDLPRRSTSIIFLMHSEKWYFRLKKNQRTSGRSLIHERREQKIGGRGNEMKTARRVNTCWLTMKFEKII